MKDKKLSDFLPNKNSVYFKKFKFLKSAKLINKSEVVEKIKNVMDPEIPVNLYDLGLIYKIEIDKFNNISIDMTLTNPNCPVAGILPKNLGLEVEKIQNISSVRVRLVWEPKWNKDMMSEEAKLALDIY